MDLSHGQNWVTKYRRHILTFRRFRAAYRIPVKMAVLKVSSQYETVAYYSVALDNMRTSMYAHGRLFPSPSFSCVLGGLDKRRQVPCQVTEASAPASQRACEAGYPLIQPLYRS